MSTFMDIEKIDQYFEKSKQLCEDEALDFEEFIFPDFVKNSVEEFIESFKFCGDRYHGLWRALKDECISVEDFIKTNKGEDYKSLIVNDGQKYITHSCKQFT